MIFSSAMVLFLSFRIQRSSGFDRCPDREIESRIHCLQSACQYRSVAGGMSQMLYMKHVKHLEILTLNFKPSSRCHFGSVYTRPPLIAIAILADQIKVAS
jgi:hypothetical protein